MINSISGALTFVNSPNFESPSDLNADNLFLVSVQASDGFFTASQLITVIVNDLNEAPIFNIGPDQSLLEDSGAKSIASFLTNIQAGTDPEPGQLVSFSLSVTGLTGTLSFVSAPSIDSSGLLNFHVAPDTNGTATISVIAKDDGGTSNGGIDTSLAKIFTITVQPINDAPSFSIGGDRFADEDSGIQTDVGFVITSSVGPSDESKQSLSYIVSNSNNSLFAIQPAISTDGTLSYTVAPNVNGQAIVTVTARDTGGTSNGGLDTSDPQTFLITVGDINDAPSFTLGTSQTLLEDSGSQSVTSFLTNISPGPSNESTQSVSFILTTDNPSLFAIAPAIDSNGDLTYTLAANANGTAKVSVIAKDDGGTANGGIDTSAQQSFTVVVTPVNDAPSFMAETAVTVNEDIAPQAVPGFLTNIAAGPTNESGQTISFQVMTDNPSLFLIPPTIDSNGTLSYRVQPNTNGKATVTVIATDNGGTANGGLNTSLEQSFTITINAVNDAPSFIVGSSQSVMGDSGPQSFADFVTSITAGPDDETAQLVSFLVSVDNPALFSALPTIDATGTLRYTPAPLANGAAVVSVIGQDNGGTVNGGVDQSVAITFTVAVTSFQDPVATVVTTAEDTLTSELIMLDTGLASSPVTHFRVSGIRNGILYRADGQTFVTDGDFLPVSVGVDGLRFLPFANANASTNPEGFGFSLQNSTAATVTGLVRTPVDVRVSVTPVNDAPTFTAFAPAPYTEDAGPQTIGKFALNIQAGPSSATDELSQPLQFAVDVLNASSTLAFTQLPNIDTAGNLTFETAPDAFGTATLRITLDDGSGGRQTTDVPIVVQAVNDVPTITVPNPIVPAAGVGSQVIPGVVQFNPGASNETEPVNVNVQIAETSGNVAFVVPPSISRDGTLTFTPDRASIGTVKLAIVADDGAAFAPIQFVTVQVDSTGRYELVGYPQFAVGTDAGQSNATFFNPDTSVRFFSAAFPGSEFGARVASADFTGDGIADLVVGLGVGTPSALQVIDGVTQRAIFEFHPFEASFLGGIFVSAGDVTGDRIADIVITPDEGGGPRVRIIDGSTFTVIADFFGIDDPNFRGGARTAIGDLNFDGIGDLAVAAGFGGGPRIAAFDGKSLASAPVKLFNDFFAFEQSLRNGVYIAVGDLDGDGVSEIIAGGGPGGGPRVVAFDGRDLMQSGGGTLNLIANFFAGAESDRGGVRVAVKDLDGDKQADLVVGSGGGNGSRVSGYLGPTLLAGILPSSIFSYDVFEDFTGGVYVG